MPRTTPYPPLRQLYDQDFARWIEATVTCLKTRDLEPIDWDGLIEEIEDLGRSEKRELESRLSVLLVHLLKRCYVDLPDCHRGWQLTIIEQRNALKRLLKQSPSLGNYLQAQLDEVYQEAWAEALTAYPDHPFPGQYPFSRQLDELLDKAFWQENR